ncbi:MAG: hypothetical protein KC478_08965 [Bacteriovoracaceae bacterium]|nr:hypothetical protein [Bacteriovoracaceae bacterium]
MTKISLYGLLNMFFLPFVFGTFSTHAYELKSGDILLQPLNCWSCSLIEVQENSIYSHMGVYLKIDGEEYVLEASEKVSLTPLQDFVNKTQRNQRIGIKRFRNILFTSKELEDMAYDYVGLSYDNSFLWDNEDDAGEMLYCSELVYKFFYPFYGERLPLKNMRYDKLREHWEKFFKGSVPDGLPGNSPADFDNSNLFEHIGEL